jgi:hypothetical protein
MINIDKNNLILKSKWVKINLNKKEINLKQFDSIPSIYRWIFKDSKGSTQIYIGETQNFKKRIKQYFKPGSTQFTSKRINSYIVNFKSYSLERLDIDKLKINSDVIINKNNIKDVLASKFIRQLIENYFITLHLHNYKGDKKYILINLPFRKSVKIVNN